MSEWKKMKLEEICLSISDGDHQPPPKSNTGVAFITISDIDSQNQINFDNVMHVPQEYYDSLDSKRKAQVGDILYSVVGSFGIPVIVKEPRQFVFQRHIAILRPDKERVIPGFLYYAMLNRDFYQRADMVAIGSAQRTISLSSLRDMVLTIPDIAIQEAVANRLSAYDDLIENNNRQIKLLEEAAQRLFKEWFVDLHFPGAENCRIVDGLPEGWHKDAVDSKISLLSGYAFKSSDFVDKGQYKIVTIKNVKDGDFDGNNVSLIDEIPLKMPQHCLLEEGDILLSLTGNVGRVCLVYGDNYLLNQRVAKLKSDIPGFAYCLFRSRDMFDEMNNLANGAAQQNLSPIRTGKVEVCFPSDDIIQRFETTVKPMIDQEIELNKMNVVLTEARDRLLPKLMSGEIEV